MMTDREKVIKGLKCCIRQMLGQQRVCDECPYDEDFNCLGCSVVLRQAIALLKEQEPHIMTREEVVEYTTGDPYTVEARAPLYVQFKNDNEFTLGWRHAIDVGAMIGRRKERYGKTWVCWTTRPTDEQRKAVKWND